MTASSASITLLVEQGFLGQRLMQWQGLDLSALVKAMRGLGLTVSIRELGDVLNSGDAPSGFYFYASSQRPGEREYVLTAVSELSARGARLIVPPDVLLCHENKGMQSLVARRKRIPMPEQRIVFLAGSSDAAVERACGSLRFPLVVKAISGAASTGVWLCHSAAEVRRLARKQIGWRTSGEQFRALVRALAKRVLAPRRFDPEQVRYLRGGIPLVLQQFLPGLTQDYKVLVFGDVVFVLERKVRRNDFRASGSGLFSTPEHVPGAVLDLAESVRARLEVPFVSIDVAVVDGEAVCIEFQPVHFGPITFLRADWHFERAGDGWRRHVGRRWASLEAVYSHAIGWWLSRGEAVERGGALGKS